MHGKIKSNATGTKTTNSAPPILLNDSQGETLYQCEHNAYEQIIDETYHHKDKNRLPDNPLRFHGQYIDEDKLVATDLNNALALTLQG